MEFLQDKWYLLVIIFFYLIFFLPTVAMSFITIFVMYGLPLIFLIVPNKYLIKILNKIGTIPKEDIGEMGFKTGLYIRNLRDELTKSISSKIPRKTIIFPIQKYILDNTVEIYDTILGGFLKGARNGIKSLEESEINRTKLERKERNSFLMALVYILMFFILSYPILILVALLGSLFI